MAPCKLHSYYYKVILRLCHRIAECSGKIQTQLDKNSKLGKSMVTSADVKDPCDLSSDS